MRVLILSVLLFCISSSNAQSSEEKVLIDKFLSLQPPLEKVAEISGLLSRNGYLEYIPLYMPLRGKFRISSSFGMRLHPTLKVSRFHSGVDLATELGTCVHAAASGKVIFSGRRSGYGRCVMIQHKYGYQTVYAHLSAYYTKKGCIVRQGEVIGFVGSTGRSTGNHLHFEVRHHNKAIPPFINNNVWKKK